MKRMQRITAVVLVLLLTFALTPCSEQQEQFSLRISLPEQVNTLDPALVSNQTEMTVVSHLYENLLKLTDDGSGWGKAVGGMALNYRCENNEDGTQTYTFALRNGITWSDGVPVKAGDFVYAWQRLVDPATGSPNAHVLEMVAGYDAVRDGGDVTKLQVSAPDDKTLVVVLESSCLYFAEVVGTHAATMPVLADMTAAENWSMNPATLVTNGAYRKVGQLSEGALWVSVDEEYYDAAQLGPDELQFTFAAVDEEADFVLTYDGVEGEEWNNGYLPRVGSLVINQMASLPEALRQAMSLTVDRNEISDLLGSVYVPAEGLIPFGIRTTQNGQFRELVGQLIENDPEEYESRCQAARELLVGQELPAEGHISLMYENEPATEQAAQTLQTMWEEQLDIRVRLIPMESSEMVRELQKGNFTMALVMDESEYNDASAILRGWKSGATENYAHINNSAYDLLMRISDASASTEARDAYLGDAERMLLENGYVVPLCFVTDGWRLAEGLSGVFSDGMGGYRFTHMAKTGK